MLDAELENQLVAAYLLKGVKWIEAQATDSDYVADTKMSTPLEHLFDYEAKSQLYERELVNQFVESYGEDRPSYEKWIAFLEKKIEPLRDVLRHKSVDACPFDTKLLVECIKRDLGVKVTETEIKRLALNLTEAKIQLTEAEISSLKGHWTALRSIRDSATKSLQTPYVDFKTIINDYIDSYHTEKIKLAPKTFGKVEVECRVLLEILGNIGIGTVNSHEELTKLKKVLRKYPINKQQFFGNKSVHSISGYNGLYISPKTANNYI